MTDEKRKLIADSWCEVQTVKIDKTGNPITDVMSKIEAKRAIWEKHGLLNDADLEEWMLEQDVILSTDYPQ